jgi:hypothetical protein
MVAWEKKREGRRIIASIRFFIGVDLEDRRYKKYVKIAGWRMQCS